MMTIDIIQESYTLVDHDDEWTNRFHAEKEHLRQILPHEVIGRIEHIGSTAIRGIKSKPIIDMLMEVTSQHGAQNIVAPILEAQGYTHITHHGLTQDEPSESSWFIKRGSDDQRTHHIRCAESDIPIRDRVLFVRYLNDYPEHAQAYESLKLDLLQQFPEQRRKYHAGKAVFIDEMTRKAREQYM